MSVLCNSTEPYMKVYENTRGKVAREFHQCAKNVFPTT